MTGVAKIYTESIAHSSDDTVEIVLVFQWQFVGSPCGTPSFLNEGDDNLKAIAMSEFIPASCCQRRSRH